MSAWSRIWAFLPLNFWLPLTNKNYAKYTKEWMGLSMLLLLCKLFLNITTVHDNPLATRTTIYFCLQSTKASAETVYKLFHYHSIASVRTFWILPRGFQKVLRDPIPLHSHSDRLWISPGGSRWNWAWRSPLGALGSATRSEGCVGTCRRRWEPRTLPSH